MRAVHKRYLRELLLGLAVYVLLIILYVTLVPHTESLFWRAVLSVLPLFPIVWIIRAIVRVIRGQDELERRIDLEAIAIGAMLTGFGFFTMGLLMSADVAGKLDPADVAIWVLPCLFGTFGVVKYVLVRRYRIDE